MHIFRRYAGDQYHNQGGGGGGGGGGFGGGGGVSFGRTPPAVTSAIVSSTTLFPSRGNGVLLTLTGTNFGVPNPGADRGTAPGALTVQFGHDVDRGNWLTCLGPVRLSD